MRGRVLRVVCAWCGRQKLEGRWILRVESEATATPPPIGTITSTSHGMCPDCAANWSREEAHRSLLEALRERRQVTA